MANRKYLTLQEAADELGVSIDTLRRAYRRTDDTRLPIVKVGRSTVRVLRRDWEQWLERHRGLQQTA